MTIEQQGGQPVDQVIRTKRLLHIFAEGPTVRLVRDFLEQLAYGAIAEEELASNHQGHIDGMSIDPKHYSKDDERPFRGMIRVKWEDKH